MAPADSRLAVRGETKRGFYAQTFSRRAQEVRGRKRSQGQSACLFLPPGILVEAARGRSGFALARPLPAAGSPMSLRSQVEGIFT